MCCLVSVMISLCFLEMSSQGGGKKRGGDWQHTAAGTVGYWPILSGLKAKSLKMQVKGAGRVSRV
jgi:hypothetical protein